MKPEVKLSIEEQSTQIINFPTSQEVVINGVRQKRPTVIAGDWDPRAVNIAQEVASQQLVDRFLASAERTRTYRPEDIIVKDELEGLSRLGEDTVHLIKTFNQTEMYIQDYTRHGLAVIKNSPSRVTLMNRWGYEESRHQRLLTGGMLAAGLTDRVSMNSVIENVFKNGWDIDQHGELGIKDLLFYLLGDGQEDEAMDNYLNLFHRITRDYNKIPLEEAKKIKIIDPTQQRGFQRIASVIYIDESAHRGGYRGVTVMLFRFRPHEILSLTQEAEEDFVMPVVNKMPSAAARAAMILYGSPEDTDKRQYRQRAANSYKEKYDALKRTLGLENPEDLPVAIGNAQSLSLGSRRFEVWLPNGTFQEVAKAA